MTNHNDSGAHQHQQSQHLLELSMRALYAAAGVTDVLAERVREYAETQQEAAKARRAKVNEQVNAAFEFVREAPHKARNVPENLQEQVDMLMKDLNLNFDEMAMRGETRIHELRTQAASGARRTVRRGADTATDVANEAAASAAEAADEATAATAEAAATIAERAADAADATEDVADGLVDDVDDLADDVEPDKAKPAKKTAKKAPAKKKVVDPIEDPTATPTPTPEESVGAEHTMDSDDNK